MRQMTRGWTVFGIGVACMVAGVSPAGADAPPAPSRWFLADGSFIAIAPHPPQAASSTLTKTIVPPGAAVLQSTLAMSSGAGAPEGAQTADVAEVRVLDALPGAPCAAGCGHPPGAPPASVSYDITVPAGGPRSASARIRLTLDGTTRGQVALRASASTVAHQLRVQLAADSIRAAWVSSRRDVLVLELGDPGDCCPNGSTVSWVSLDLQRLIGTGSGEAPEMDAASGSAMARAQQWKKGLPSGWQVGVRQVGVFVVAQAAAPAAPMGSGVPSCSEDDGVWTKTHRTLLATDSGQAEVAGVVVESPVDLDRDGRQDLLVAYEHSCRAGAEVQTPAGDFVVVLNKPGGVVVKEHAPVGAPSPAALWNVALQRQGRALVIRAAGMKSGATPTPAGEMFEFKWVSGEVALARRFPGS